MNHTRNVVLLGTTGSIGQSTLRVAKLLPNRVRLVGLSAFSNATGLVQAAKEFDVTNVCLADENAATATRGAFPVGTRVYGGEEGLVQLATLPEADIVLIAIVGTAGLRPALAAIEAGKDIAVASKEILVMAGHIVMKAARRKGVRVLPIDSEHNAIFQCLEGHSSEHVKRLLLTCSGGPFRSHRAEEFPEITPEQALNHPTWRMGRKISIDSATLFNKGLEMIEARWLFDLTIDRVDVIIHPQSIIHSMVEFIDGSVLAQLSYTDMAFPIQYALTWPDRIHTNQPSLDFAKLKQLDFFPPREDDFPALRLAREAGMRDGVLPAVFNAANEIAVEAFLQKQIRFPSIWEIVEETMARVPQVEDPSLEQVLGADQTARQIAREIAQNESAVVGAR